MAAALNQDYYGNYGTLAKEVYSAARKERWTPDRVKQMLNNPRDFEKYLNRVSLNSILSEHLRNSHSHSLVSFLTMLVSNKI